MKNYNKYKYVYLIVIILFCYAINHLSCSDYVLPSYAEERISML